MQKCCRPCRLLVQIILLKDSCVLLVNRLQKWARSAQRWASQWEIFHFCECWNSCEEGAGECQVVENNQWGFRWSWYLVLISAGNSDIYGWMDVCKICSTFADRWSKLVLEDNYKWIVWKVSAGHQLPVKVVTGDESLVFAYDPETKRESSEWHTTFSPQPEKFQFAKLNLKVMLIAFFIENLCWRDNSVYYLLCSGWYHIYGTNWEESKVEKWCNWWILHHDNTPQHSAMAVQQFLVEKHITPRLQPPYLPDLAPCDLWLFPRLNTGLQHQRFTTVEDIKCSVTAGYTPYYRRISMSPSEHGKTIGASVCVQKGCTWWVIRLESTALQLRKLDGWILGTFWYSHMFVRHRFICGHMNVKSRIKQDIFCEYLIIRDNMGFHTTNYEILCKTEVAS